MDNKSRELIAVAASIAGNCMPCLRYHFKEVLSHGCTLEEIEEAITMAKTVKERPMNDIYSLSSEMIDRSRNKVPETMPSAQTAGGCSCGSTGTGKCC